MIQTIYYNSPEFRTLGDFLEQEGLSPAFAYKDSPQQFLLIRDKAGKSNYTKILEASPEEDRQAQSNKWFSGQFNQLELSPPIVFSIDSEKAKTDLYSVQGDLVQNTAEINYFISTQLAGLMLNPQYVLRSRLLSTGDVKGTHPKLSVWLWSRVLSGSLSFSSIGAQTNYELINLSPFIDSINVSSTKEGGSFSFTIAPIKAVFKDNLEGWKLDKNSISFETSKEDLRYRAILPIENKSLENSNYFFHNIIQQNDMIFISFEDLPFEKNNFRSEINVPFSAINSKNWDMIGLIDNNQLTVSKESKANVEINISGRDLTKAIIEDGSYFWATEFGLDGTIQFAGNRDNRIAQRIEAAGFIDHFSIANKSIEYSLRFIISQLANTGIIPNYVLQNYGSRRSTIFSKETIGRETILEKKGKALNSELFITVKEKKGLKEVVADGIWGITKIIIDPQIANLRLVDAALFTEQGSLINYIQRLCQEPFVEFYTETIKDQFYWIARRPPFGKRSILGAINGEYVNDSEEIASDSLFKHLSDEGSLEKVIGSSSEGSFSRTNSFVIDIESLDTISIDVRFDERAFSWFKLESRYALGGGAENLASLALLPAVFLPTYTNLFGSRPLNVSSSYVNYIPSGGVDGENNYKNAVEQAYYDLAWLIETNAYLPFTRIGQITINEDRRIKKGMHIRLKATKEIYLVTAVNHQMSISNTMERRTVLQVERGMVEDYIQGRDIQGLGKVGYFELVSTPINLKRVRASKEVDTRISSGNQYTPITNWKENEAVINFFIRRQQFQ